MYTERAFQEAESKGYHCVNRIISVNYAKESIDIDRDYYFTLGDPRFWKAFGEARGWREPDELPRWKKQEGTTLVIFFPDDSWAAWQHRYIDHIIEHGYNNHQKFFKQFYPSDEQP